MSSEKVKCIEITHDRNIIIRSLLKSELPSSDLLKNSLYPQPFHFNAFNGSKYMKDKIFGTDALQISFPYFGKLRDKYNKKLVFIFPRPKSWTQLDFIDLFRTYGGDAKGKKGGHNELGIFLNKAHRILGSVVLYHTERDLESDDYNDFMKMSEMDKSVPELFEIIDNTVKVKDFKTIQQARLKLVEILINKFKEFHFLTLETLYLVYLPQLLEYYVELGYEHHNTVPCYTFDYKGPVMRVALCQFTNNIENDDNLWHANDKKITKRFKPTNWNKIHKHMKEQSKRFKFKYNPFFS